MLKSNSSFSYDQAVILQIQPEDDPGVTISPKAIEEIEYKISKVLPSEYGIDGHEFDDGECTIYIYGPDADKLWKIVEPILMSSQFSRVEVTMQYGLPDDPKTKDKSFTF